MAEAVEFMVWIAVIILVFDTVRMPFKGTKVTKHNKRYKDTTIELVNGHFMEIDKRRWDANL